MTRSQRFQFFARLLLAALGGLLTYASYEPLGWAIAGVAGAALLIAALMPQPPRPGLVRKGGGKGGHVAAPTIPQGMAIAFVYSMVQLLFLLPWIGAFVGNFPYIALCVFLSLYWLVLGAAGVRVLAWPRFGLLAFAALYSVVEWARSSFPFGGFAWVRLGWGQINGVLAELAPLGGVALVSFATVLLAGALLGLFQADTRVLSACTIALVMLVSVGSAVTGAGVAHTPAVGEVRVAAVQGNVPRLGLDFNAQRMAVLRNHVAETAAISGSEPVDLIIWPENSADVSPLYDYDAAREVTQAVQAAGAPILVGTVSRGPANGLVDEEGQPRPFNTMAVFSPESMSQAGQAVISATEVHNKKYLQPFGEYMPFRDFLRNFSSMVDYAGNFQPGTGDGVVRMTAATTGREVLVGVSTCYEVAFDAAGRDAVKAGAHILTTPTNNATFGFSDMTYQQLAMSRMRAKELDRAVVVAATSGVSAIVLPDGNITQHTEIFEAAHLVETLPLRDTITASVRVGSAIETSLVIIGSVLGLLALATRPQSTKRKGTRTTAPRRKAAGKASPKKTGGSTRKAR
ncbi:apolipoprotein N-acyltransferase [Corynebacterium kozikiae]|uniref:apolipoprotein N-acyltransferase n=1 Tax=Corynebacterium kozikiae TaxID=2968469 RepID=UPI00211C83EF|nr:apolipoprotein N-acyltransferase [Corynebacterium sp. 76QC2CO]MCQ9342905.1 apolipoprotein N-acyltransferase [Corynebacterium sp. 76QC2CO]